MLTIPSGKHGRYGRKRLVPGFVAFIVGIQGFHSFIACANAANLIQNPSVESANTLGTMPLNWLTGKSGYNTTTFTYLTNGAHTGSKSLRINVSWFYSGVAAWVPQVVQVKPNTNYTYREFYKANVASEIDIQYTNTSNINTTAILASPAASATNWVQIVKTFTTPANVNRLTIYHLINRVGNLQTDDFSLEETTPPAVSITSPALGSTVGGIQAIIATASDAVGVAGVQFKVDGVNVGTEDKTAPYSVSWNTAGLQNCSPHTITATARNVGNLTTTASQTVNVLNGAAVAITSPVAGATVAGTIPLTAEPTGTCQLLGVQIQVDGVNIGAEITIPPYNTDFNTSALTNGSHTVTAIGRQINGSTIATGAILVNNFTGSPGNVVPNPSFEANVGGQPTNWIYSSYGTNTNAFSYLNTSHTGSHSVRMEISDYTNGGILVFHTPQSVTGGHYLYSEWYQSNVATEVDARITFNDGTTQVYYLATVPASPTKWKQSKIEFDLPANAVSIAVYPVLYSIGWLEIDDISFAKYTPGKLNRGLVSITFDDGYTSQYNNAFQALLKNKYGLALPATFYIVSGNLNNQPTYTTSAQVIDLLANGMEIGSHTVTHASLTTLSQTDLINEMSQSKQTLETTIGAAVNNFAYPYGNYNDNTMTVGEQYYLSQRNSDAGYNTKDLFDLTSLKIKAVNNGITPAQVNAWVDQAIAEKSWLILVYHQVEPTQPLPVGNLYTTLPENLDAELQYIKDSGIGVVTVDQAIREILPQL